MLGARPWPRLVCPSHEGQPLPESVLGADIRPKHKPCLEGRLGHPARGRHREVGTGEVRAPIPTKLALPHLLASSAHVSEAGLEGGG